MWKIFFNYSDTLFPLLVLLILIPNIKKLGRAGIWLTIYLVLTVVILGYSNILADRVINNSFLYHSYSIVEIATVIPLLALFMNRVKVKDYAVISLFVIYSIVNIFLWESLMEFNSNSSSIAALIIIVYSFGYFLHLANTDAILRFQTLPSFWIVSGFLFYCVVTVLVTASYKYSDWFSSQNITWKIQQVANIIRFVLISIGILCSRRQTYRDGLSL
ncbi:MAG TPA: hypothetical protein VIK74_07930 [Parasegetibacter sp.]